MKNKMKNYMKLMRIKHYLKNFLIFLPIIFSGLIFESNNCIKTIFAFISFCMAASVVYIINDIRDKEKDKLHEKKKNRPIASGKVSIKNAIILIIILAFISMFFNYLSVGVNSYSYLCVIVYICINILYSFGFKNIPLVDIAILVSGFIIRVLYGASVVNVEVSNWLYLTVISFSFYLCLGKRRNEIIKVGIKGREVLKYYNKNFLDKNMYMCLAMTIIFYALWCVDKNFNGILVWTVPLIILICMKYSMNIENDSYGDPIEVVFEDKVLLILIFIYGLIMFGILYTPNIM